jgi:hypothetical protein
MHNLLKHKMLQFLFKSVPYIAPTCFGPHGPSSGSTYQNLTKVTISLKYQLKHFVKIVVLWQLGISVCGVCAGAVWRVTTHATQHQRNIAQSHATQHQSTHYKLKSPIATEQLF